MYKDTETRTKLLCTTYKQGRGKQFIGPSTDLLGDLLQNRYTSHNISFAKYR